MMATLMAVLGSMLLGAATWGVLEYLLHRFVGHSPRSMTQFAREHRQHHSMGNYFAPAAKKALVAVPVMGTVAALGWWWLGPVAASYTLGLASMYLAYEWFHRRLHTHPPRGAFGPGQLDRWALLGRPARKLRATYPGHLTSHRLSLRRESRLDI